MAGERWIFTKEQLLNTPSRKSGIENDRELIYRQQAANLIQDMGQRLQVTQLCINTAIVYMHRFYMFHSFQKFHRSAMAAACLFLAAKVEEQPRKLEHVIKVSNICQNKETAVDTKSEEYLNEAHQLVINESILLQTLGFDLTVDHPHTNVVKTCQLVKASKDLAQTSYFLATNSLHLTTMCLLYKPTIVACVCVHLACKWSKWEIPRSQNEGKEWFWYMDKAATTELLEELTQEFLNILDQCPSKLKKKILMWRSGKEREKQTDEFDTQPPEKKTKTETSATSTSSSKSHPSSHHHTASNHDRKSDKSEHTKTSPSKNINKNAVESKPNSLSVSVVPTVKEEPQVEVKSEPVVTEVPVPSTPTTITTYKEYKERKERERLLAMNKPKDQIAPSVKTEKSDGDVGEAKQDGKQSLSRNVWADLQKSDKASSDGQKQSEKPSSDIQKHGDKHADTVKHGSTPDAVKREDRHKHRHTPDVSKHGEKHTPDAEKHRKSSSHKHLAHESKRHSHDGTKHSHSKHSDNKHSSDNDPHKNVVTNHEPTGSELGKFKIKTDPGGTPHVNEICKIRIKTDQGGSPVVKQEAEMVPGSEMKIRIKTESGISPRTGVSPRLKVEQGVSPRIKTEPGISPTVSQDAASPLKMKIKNISKEHHKSSHSEQKVPSLKISSKMLTESHHGDRKSREHKSHKSKHSDKEQHKSHTGTNGKPELKLHINMAAINKHKSDSESRKHHKSSHSEKSSSDEKSSGKSAHHKKDSSHSFGNRKRHISPNADTSAQNKNKMSKTESVSGHRSSADYSVVSMDLSDSASADGSSGMNGDKKQIDEQKHALDQQIQAMSQVIDLFKSNNPKLANSLPGTPTSCPPPPPPPPSLTQPPQPPPPSLLSPPPPPSLTQRPPHAIPPPPPPPLAQQQLYHAYPGQFGNQFAAGQQYIQPQSQYGYQQSLFDFDFLSDEALPPLPSDPPARPPSPPLPPPPPF